MLITQEISTACPRLYRAEAPLDSTLTARRMKEKRAADGFVSECWCKAQGFPGTVSAQGIIGKEREDPSASSDPTDSTAAH